VADALPTAPAIRFGSKVGILIHNRVLFDNSRDPIRDQWHTYQRNPSAGLDGLVAATDKVANWPGQVHIALSDLETPYVDSDVNAHVLWSTYLEALDKRNLLAAFSPLAQHLDWFDQHAEEIKPPHRTLERWARHDAQLDYMRRAYDRFCPQTLTERKRWILAVARCSDVLSAMDSKIRAQDKSLPAYMVKYREELLRLGAACLNILAGNKPLEALAEADPVLGPRLIKVLEGIPDR